MFPICFRILLPAPSAKFSPHLPACFMPYPQQHLATPLGGELLCCRRGDDRWSDLGSVCHSEGAGVTSSYASAKTGPVSRSCFRSTLCGSGAASRSAPIMTRSSSFPRCVPRQPNKQLPSQSNDAARPHNRRVGFSTSSGHSPPQQQQQQNDSSRLRQQHRRGLSFKTDTAGGIASPPRAASVALHKRRSSVNVMVRATRHSTSANPIPPSASPPRPPPPRVPHNTIANANSLNELLRTPLTHFPPHTYSCNYDTHHQPKNTHTQELRQQEVSTSQIPRRHSVTLPVLSSSWLGFPIPAKEGRGREQALERRSSFGGTIMISQPGLERRSSLPGLAH